jgi:selenocysteine lyase/cysteine desulfurase
VDLAHAAGAWVFVDGVAFAPHGMPTCRALGVDAYYFSLYKVYGPHLGAMFLRREVNEALPNQGHFFNDGKPATLHARGPDHAQDRGGSTASWITWTPSPDHQAPRTSP